MQAVIDELSQQSVPDGAGPADQPADDGDIGPGGNDDDDAAEVAAVINANAAANADQQGNTDWKLASWNVNGLGTATADIANVLRRQRPDVLALQDIKIRPTDAPPRKYTRHAVVPGENDVGAGDADGGHGYVRSGGLALYVHKRWTATTLRTQLGRHVEEQWVALAPREDSTHPCIVVGNVYIRPGLPDAEQAQQEITELCAAANAYQGEYDNVVLCGDLNADHPSHATGTRVRNTTALRAVCNQAGLVPLRLQAAAQGRVAEAWTYSRKQTAAPTELDMDQAAANGWVLDVDAEGPPQMYRMQTSWLDHVLVTPALTNMEEMVHAGELDEFDVDHVPLALTPHVCTPGVPTPDHRPIMVRIPSTAVRAAGLPAYSTARKLRLSAMDRSDEIKQQAYDAMRGVAEDFYGRLQHVVCGVPAHRVLSPAGLSQDQLSTHREQLFADGREYNTNALNDLVVDLQRTLWDRLAVVLGTTTTDSHFSAIWWNDDLQQLFDQVHDAGRRYRRAINRVRAIGAGAVHPLFPPAALVDAIVEASRAHTAYKTARRAFSHATRRAKTKSFKEYMSTLDIDADEAHGQRLHMDKSRWSRWHATKRTGMDKDNMELPLDVAATHLSQLGRVDQQVDANLRNTPIQALRATYEDAAQHGNDDTPPSDDLWFPAAPTAGDAPAELMMLDTPITAAEVDRALVITPGRKAPGLTGLYGAVWKMFGRGSVTGLELMRAIFQVSAQTGVFPDSLKLGCCTFLHKKGDRADPGNYRTITLLPVLGKIYEKVLAQRLTYALRRRELAGRPVIEGFQFGFRPTRSCQEAMMWLEAARQTANGAGRPLYAIGIDLRKAFDSISHAGLVKALEASNAGPRTVRLVSDWLARRKVRPDVDGTGELVDMCRGIPQGSVWSPTLFDVCFAELSRCWRHSGVRVQYGVGEDQVVRVGGLSFADDCIVLSDDIDELRGVWQRIQACVPLWGLSIAPRKCEAIAFVPDAYTAAQANEARARMASFYVGEEENDASRVPACRTITYLGNTVHERLSTPVDYSDRVRTAMARSAWCTSAFRAYTVPLRGLAMFKSAVLPAVQYGLEFLHSTPLGEGHRLQVAVNNGIRHVTGSFTSTHARVLRALTGVLSVRHLYHMGVMQLCARLVHSPYRLTRMLVRTQLARPTLPLFTRWRRTLALWGEGNHALAPLKYISLYQYCAGQQAAPMPPQQMVTSVAMAPAAAQVFDTLADTRVPVDPTRATDEVANIAADAEERLNEDAYAWWKAHVVRPFFHAAEDAAYAAYCEERVGTSHQVQQVWQRVGHRRVQLHDLFWTGRNARWLLTLTMDDAVPRDQVEAGTYRPCPHCGADGTTRHLFVECAGPAAPVVGPLPLAARRAELLQRWGMTEDDLLAGGGTATNRSAEVAARQRRQRLEAVGYFARRVARLRRMGNDGTAAVRMAAAAAMNDVDEDAWAATLAGAGAAGAGPAGDGDEEDGEPAA